MYLVTYYKFENPNVLLSVHIDVHDVCTGRRRAREVRIVPIHTTSGLLCGEPT